MIKYISLEEFKKMLENAKKEHKEENTNQSELINPLNSKSYESSRKSKTINDGSRNQRN